MDHLHEFFVPEAPPSVFYIPEFITKEEETHILDKVYSVPKPKWTHLSNRRLQDYGGVPHKNGMICEKIPAWLELYMKRITDLKVYGDKEANHVLINEYLPNQGIMPHTDGPLFYPTIATISCGSHTILEFSCTDKRDTVCNLLLEPRSLIILQDDMYTKHLHSISEVTEDEITDKCANLSKCKNYKLGQIAEREVRISLTIRNVPKVCKLKLWNL
ncbi:hypothetical protein PPYR_04916 [Photinus pyralis]|uniref:Fe2OG dioxygenase domain-containing protein n=1 Tax=Photinus pyralis TaxID=7054 RepID=A0A1Y1NMY4_PHOPY|nr:alpha-ketoglutarate-dependent dioxygenase alkB homolog 6 [Photinus pyralis]KAB0802730.1 hypothetical protein PPYR_04916 [Photinus pyralis]